MSHVATPSLPVGGDVQDSALFPLRVKVTGSPETGLPEESVSTADTGVGVSKEKLPDVWGGDRFVTVCVVTVGEVAAMSWPSTVSPNRRPGLPVEKLDRTFPVARSTCQTSPEIASPVQNEVPLGSTLTPKRRSSQPGSDPHEYVWSTLPLWSKSNTAVESATSTSPLARILSWKAPTPVKGTWLKVGPCMSVHLL